MNHEFPLSQAAISHTPCQRSITHLCDCCLRQAEDGVCAVALGGADGLREHPRVWDRVLVQRPLQQPEQRQKD